jgi:hypothetical protein
LVEVWQKEGNQHKGRELDNNSITKEIFDNFGVTWGKGEHFGAYVGKSQKLWHNRNKV